MGTSLASAGSDSKFTPIHPGEVMARAQTTDFQILRIPLQLDLADLQKRLRESEKRFPWLTKDSQPGYRGLGLQYSNFDQRFTDSVDASSRYESDASGGYPQARNIRPFHLYEKLNEAGELFDPLFLRLKPLRTFRSRLLTLKPGYEMKSPHVDGDLSVRLHIPLETDPGAWMDIEDHRYHLPADGSGYLVNTSLFHRVGNAGKKDRTHFVAMIYPRFPNLIHPLAQAALIRFIVGPMRGSKVELGKKVSEAQEQSQGRCALCDQTFKRLYVVPLLSTRLKALCAQCIEDVGRKTANQFSSGADSETAFSTSLEHLLGSRL